MKTNIFIDILEPIKLKGNRFNRALPIQRENGYILDIEESLTD